LNHEAAAFNVEDPELLGVARGGVAIERVREVGCDSALADV
jgi:hypothetical protein